MDKPLEVIVQEQAEVIQTQQKQLDELWILCKELANHQLESVHENVKRLRDELMKLKPVNKWLM
jgi:hypothetical protein